MAKDNFSGDKNWKFAFIMKKKKTVFFRPTATSLSLYLKPNNVISQFVHLFADTCHITIKSGFF